MAEKVELLSEVLQVESMSQQVCQLSRHAEELQQSIKIRLQSLEDANKVCREKNRYLLDYLVNLLLVPFYVRVDKSFIPEQALLSVGYKYIYSITVFFVIRVWKPWNMKLRPYMLH